MKQYECNLRETNYQFNSADDFINFKVSFNCDENRDRFYDLIHKFCDELTELVKNDRKMAENADISKTE